MMGAGGAIMLWTLACKRTGFDILVDPAYGRPFSAPAPRVDCGPGTGNYASTRYYEMVDSINLLGRVWPYSGREQTIWLDGPRHTLNTELAG